MLMSCWAAICHAGSTLFQPKPFNIYKREFIFFFLNKQLWAIRPRDLKRSIFSPGLRSGLINILLWVFIWHKSSLGLFLVPSQQTLYIDFSLSWSCGSRQRDTTSSGWKMLFHCWDSVEHHIIPGHWTCSFLYYFNSLRFIEHCNYLALVNWRTHPADTRRWINIGLALAHRPRPTLNQHWLTVLCLLGSAFSVCRYQSITIMTAFNTVFRFFFGNKRVTKLYNVRVRARISRKQLKNQS